MATGRPKKKIDWNMVDALCKLQCTHEEIAGALECCVETLAAACKRDKGIPFSEYFEQKRGLGKISLRRYQFRLAEKSAAMAIFLGKNMLGQRDVLDMTITKTQEEAQKEIEGLMADARTDYQERS